MPEGVKVRLKDPKNPTETALLPHRDLRRNAPDACTLDP